MSSDDRKSPKDQTRSDDQNTIQDLDAKKDSKADEQVMGGRQVADAAALKKADLSSRFSI